MRLLLLALALATSAAAQAPTGSLSGIVTDDTGEPLPGATVFLPEIQRGAATDLDGVYAIVGIPSGTYRVEFSSVGFAFISVPSIQVFAGRTSQLDASLESGWQPLCVVIDGGCDPFWLGRFRGVAYHTVACREQIETRPDRYEHVPVSSLMSTYRR